MERRQFRIVVFRNGTEENGILIRVESNSVEALLARIRKSLESSKSKDFEQYNVYTRIFTFHGTEITQIEQLRDGDVVYVSSGEGFLHPGQKRVNPDQEFVKLNFNGQIFYASKETLRTCAPESINLIFNANTIGQENVTCMLDPVSKMNVQKLQFVKNEIIALPFRLDGNGPINKLPVEMLEKILDLLPTIDMLQCRLTNRLWENILSPLCRQRHVTLRRINDAPGQLEQNCILNVFEKSGSIPWSSHTFNDSTDAAGFQKELLRLYGPEFLHIKLIGHFDFFLRTLRMTPYITYLQLAFAKDILAQHTRKFKTCNHFPLVMVNLKHLEIDLVEDAVVDFLEFLFSSSRLPALKYFKSKLQLNTGEAAKKLSILLSKIPLLSIDIQYIPATAQAFRAFISLGKQLRAQNLRLRLEEPPVGNWHQFAPAERLLNSCAGTLEALSLDCTSDVFCGVSPIPLRIPKMRNLKSLEFTYIYHGVDYMHTGFLSNFFINLTSNHFPNLHKVIIQESCHVRRFGLASAIFSTCKSVQFESVRELQINVDSLPEDCWSGIFPNIQKFIGTICESDLIRIFRNLTKLTELSVSVHNSIMGKKLDSLLSGIPAPSIIYSLSGSGREGFKAERLQNVVETNSKIPSLHWLKSLESLELRFSWPVLTDAGAYLAFVPLKPLRVFSLVNTNISDECEIALRNRHPNFVRLEGSAH